MPNKVSFYTCEWLTFVGKRDANSYAGSLTPGGLYFITDRNIIMHATAANAADPYGQTVQVTSSDLPVSGTEGILYIQQDSNGKYYGKVYNDASGEYDTVFSPASAPSGSIASGDDDAVSGDTVYTYIHTTLGLDAATDVGGASHAGEVVKLNSNGLIDASTMLSTTATGGSGTNGKIVKLNASGLIDDTMLSTTTSGGSGNGNKLVKLTNDGLIDANMVPTTQAGGSGNGNKIVKLTSDGVIADTMLPALAISDYVENTTGTYAALSSLTAGTGDWSTVTSGDNQGSYIKTAAGTWQKLVDKYTTVTSVTENSPALVTSGGVYTAIAEAALVWNSISSS